MNTSNKSKAPSWNKQRLSLYCTIASTSFLYRVSNGIFIYTQVSSLKHKKNFDVDV